MFSRTSNPFYTHSQYILRISRRKKSVFSNVQIVNLGNFRRPFQQQGRDVSVFTVNGDFKRAAHVVGGENAAGKQPLLPQHRGNGAAAGAAGAGVALHAPLEGQNADLPIPQQLIEIHVCPLDANQ